MKNISTKSGKEGESLGMIKADISIIPIDQLEPNPWNPNKQSDFIYEKEKNSIQTFGFIDPVTVRLIEKDKFQIIDGFHRWKAAKDLGYLKIPINDLGRIPDGKAKQLTIILNELRGEYDPLKLAEIVKELSQDGGIDELIQNLPFTEQEIQNLIKVTDFNWNQFKPGAEAESSGDDEWITLEFRVSKSQGDVINQAIDRIVKGLDMDNNFRFRKPGFAPRSMALELIAADSINTPLESYQ